MVTLEELNKENIRLMFENIKKAEELARMVDEMLESTERIVERLNNLSPARSDSFSREKRDAGENLNHVS